MAAKIFELKCLHSLRSKIFVVLPKIKTSGSGFSGKCPQWRKLATVAGCLGLVPVAYMEFTPKDLRQRFNFIADVVEKVANAVVCIEVKTSRFFSIMPPNGSGFIVRNDGLILTNAHVVMNRMNSVVTVKLQDGRTFPGIVEDIDVKSDLATVRIKAENLPVMKLGSSADVRPGEWVVAIGSPLSLSNTITSGVISSAHRQSSEIGILNRHMEYIQTDASITFGNSGGPLVNLDGEAIGINCMKITGGISFAIPIDYAKSFLKKSDEKRSGISHFAKLKYTGVTVFSLTPGLLQELKNGEYDIPEEITSGLLVGKVVLGSPGHISGLKPGDVVTHVNSSLVQDINTIYKALETGKPLMMTVIRDGLYKEIVIVPEDA